MSADAHTSFGEFASHLILLQPTLPSQPHFSRLARLSQKDPCNANDPLYMRIALSVFDPIFMSFGVMLEHAILDAVSVACEESCFHNKLKKIKVKDLKLHGYSSLYS